MSSAVSFRLHSGSELSQVHFDGNGIKLLELKRAIVDLKFKVGSSSLDYELNIKDDNGKGK